VTFDANGNMIKDETGKTYKYDAWNRVVEAKNSSSAVIASYGYDALNRRIKETHYAPSTETRDLYYSADWQVIHERVGSAIKAEYVWSAVYVDALVYRNRDADNNASTGWSGLEERLYVQHDGRVARQMASCAWDFMDR
jgi:hypothetical protein